jgi:hypothetical protein
MVQLKPVEDKVVVLMGVLMATSSRMATEGLPSVANIG